MPPLPGFGNAVILRNSLFSLSGVRLHRRSHDLCQEGQDVFQHLNIAAIVKAENLLETLISKHKAGKGQGQPLRVFLQPSPRPRPFPRLVPAEAQHTPAAL